MAWHGMREQLTLLVRLGTSVDESSSFLDEISRNISDFFETALVGHYNEIKVVDGGSEKSR